MMATTVYDTHTIAFLAIPAVTVEALTSTQIVGDEGVSNYDKFTNHEVVVSVRVHTGFVGGVADSEESTQLMDQVIDTIKKNLNMDVYRVMDYEVIGINLEFEESQSIGAEAHITLHTIRNYVQA